MGKKNKKLDIDKEDLYKFYIEDKLPAKDIAKIYSCSNVSIRKYCVLYGIPLRTQGEAVKLERATWPEWKERERSEKFINTWAAKTPEEKRIINEKKSHSNTPESIAKARITRFLTKRIPKSKSEDSIYKRLTLIFDKEDIVRNYPYDRRYPFNCDFYIKSKDLFIEYQGHYTHGYEPFNPENIEHLKYLEMMNSKNIDMKTWVVRDPYKLSTSIKNNIRLVLIYPNRKVYFLKNKKLINIDINDIDKI